MAFAFILFDARHPHLRKALEDEAYWDALDEQSGRNLTVFTFLTYLRNHTPGAPPHGMRAMFAIPRSTGDVPRDILLEYLPDLGREKLPCVLFFQVENNTVTDSFAVSLSAARDAAEAYNEVAGVLATALASIERVTDDNASNSREIYHLIKSALKERALKNRAIAVYRGLRAVSPVATIVRLVSGLL